MDVIMVDPSAGGASPEIITVGPERVEGSLDAAIAGEEENGQTNQKQDEEIFEGTGGGKDFGIG